MVLVSGQRIVLTAPISSFKTPGFTHEPGTPGVLVEFIGTTTKVGLGGEYAVSCWTANLDGENGKEKVELLTSEFTTEVG